ncbi:MAG: 30S ribosomal protein S6 [Rickettsiales bacterium]|jgi:small subunit ribosomal protein S6|nr:30S ribosomal protein S6 [Rickettsiales bacterium]
MPLYETVFITRQDLTVEDVDNLTSKLCKIITDGKGKVVSKEYWGLRNLAYIIKKNNRGHYVLINIDAEYPVVQELKRVMKYNENIIRSVLFNVESHSAESLLFVSSDAKDYKNAKQTKKEPSKIDLILDQVQFEI